MSYLVCGFKKDSNLLQEIRECIVSKNVRYSLLNSNDDFVMQIINPSNEVINIVCSSIRNCCKKHNAYFYGYIQTSDLKYYKDCCDIFLSTEELINSDLSANCYYSDKSFIHFLRYDKELNNYDIKTIGSRYGDSLI